MDCMHQPMSTFSPIAPKDADSPIPSVNSIVPKRSKYQHNDMAWEAIKPTICRLYIQENMSASEVLHALRSNPDNPFKTSRRKLFTKFREWGLGKNKKYLKDVAHLGVHPGASGSGGPVASMSPSTSDSQIQDTPNLDSASQLSGDSATSPITPTEPAESICRDEEGDILSHPSESSDAVDVSGAWERLATLDVLVDIFGKRFQLVDAEGQSTSEVKSLRNTSKPLSDLFANAGTDFADSFVCFPDQEGEHASDPPTTTAGVFAGDQQDEDTDLERRNDGIDYTYQHPETGWLNTRNKPHRSFKGGDAARSPPWCDADLPKTKSGIWDTDIPRARFEQGQNLTLQTFKELYTPLEDERRESMRQFRISFINQYFLRGMKSFVLCPTSLRAAKGYGSVPKRANAMRTMRGLARLEALSTLRGLRVYRGLVQFSKGIQMLEFSCDLQKCNLVALEMGDVAAC